MPCSGATERFLEDKMGGFRDREGLAIFWDAPALSLSSIALHPILVPARGKRGAKTLLSRGAAELQLDVALARGKRRKVQRALVGQDGGSRGQSIVERGRQRRQAEGEGALRAGAHARTGWTVRAKEPFAGRCAGSRPLPKRPTGFDLGRCCRMACASNSTCRLCRVRLPEKDVRRVSTGCSRARGRRCVSPCRGHTYRKFLRHGLSLSASCLERQRISRT